MTDAQPDPIITSLAYTTLFALLIEARKELGKAQLDGAMLAAKEQGLTPDTNGVINLTLATLPADHPAMRQFEAHRKMLAVIDQMDTLQQNELGDIEKMIDDYAELRHKHGAPSYNAVTQQARRAISVKLLTLLPARQEKKE